MRHLLILFLAALCFALAQEAYYPAREGLAWTYSNGETQMFEGVKAVSGQSAQVLVHYLQGTPISEDYLIYDGNGVRSIGTAAGGQTLIYSPFLTFFPAPPLAVGQTWSSSAKVADFDISINAEVVAVRGVQTQAGRFNALQIRQQTITSTGAQTVLDLFFVPSIGIVRWLTQDGTSIDLIDKNF
ncbi:MAG: hypothetical protein KC422_03965 [Trueperaceae bacterium]|nr:hypothetical protein [Trueperaceae bacterium]